RELCRPRTKVAALVNSQFWGRPVVLSWPGREGANPLRRGPQRWRPAARRASRAAAMESSGEILVKVEGVTRISSDAKLRVRNSSGTITTFRVRLPKGMELVPTDSVGYSVSVIEAAPTASRGQAAAQTVEVAFARPQTGIVELRLLVGQGGAFAPGPLQPGHFEVVGAVRQRGTIDFSVDGDWQLSWEEDKSVRRLGLPAHASAGKPP